MSKSLTCADRAPIDPERIPEEFRQRAHEDAAKELARQQKIALLRNRLMRNTALGWLVLAFCVSLILGDWHFPFQILFCVSTALLAGAIARFRIGSLLSSLLFAATAFLFLITGHGAGLLGVNVIACFFVLLLYICLGALTAIHVDQAYSRILTWG